MILPFGSISTSRHPEKVVGFEPMKTVDFELSSSPIRNAVWPRRNYPFPGATNYWFSWTNVVSFLPLPLRGYESLMRQKHSLPNYSKRSKSERVLSGKSVWTFSCRWKLSNSPQRTNPKKSAKTGESHYFEPGPKKHSEGFSYRMFSNERNHLLTKYETLRILRLCETNFPMPEARVRCSWISAMKLDSETKHAEVVTFLQLDSERD
mmetsp:Transcript_8950/g.17917  ORF Transcript_8950/g.17917 Transcript_8950/m.17917 type:complete len:207 (+) Transcript_8950:1100-1720(+)